MRVTFKIDNMGYLVLTPVNRRIQTKIIRHLADWEPIGDRTVVWSHYEQNSQEIEYLLETFRLSKSEINHINCGWTVDKNVDNWTFLHLVGYDAHEAIDI